MGPLASLTAIILASAPMPASAQDRPSEASTIIVTGEGSAEGRPDSFSVDAGVQGRGATQTAALRELSEAQGRLLEQWPRLDGLTEGVATTGDISIAPHRDPECESNARRDDSCPILGYVAYSAIALRGAPAELAGDAVSLASDLGATSARLDEYEVSDRQALREQANRAAFEDARRQANLLASASGRRLGRLVRIQDPSAARYDGESLQIEEVVVVGSRARPTVSIAAAPEPVRVSARITVVFEIE